MRRFLGTWALLSPAYLAAVSLSSWLVLNLVDLTYEAFVSWLLIPVAQALILTVSSRRDPPFPSGRPPLLALALLALALGVVAEGLRRPLSPRLGFLVPGNLQQLLPRALAALAAATFLAAAVRVRRGRPQLTVFGVLLLLLSLDAARPFLGSLPGILLPRLGLFYGGLAIYGSILVLLFAAALAAQRTLEKANPWAARLIGISLAVTFGAVHCTLLQLFLHPWLERPWALIVPAAITVATSLVAAGGLAALVRPGEAA